LFGYFQTYKYAEEIKNVLKPMLVPKILSCWLRSYLIELESKRILSIHVRRGDYLNYRFLFGLLSVDYYVAGVQFLKTRRHQWDEIWIFSDDINQVKSEFSGVFEFQNARFIETKNVVNPFEVLYLMSKTQFGISSNSTFSWWSCFISNTMQVVIMPKKWFRSMEDPLDLFPPNWIQILSEWTD
jgi:hypothetical protein